VARRSTPSAATRRAAAAAAAAAASAAPFPELLRRARGRRGLSQRALARASRINPAVVSRLESGDRGPSGPEQVLALAAALSLDAADADALLASTGYWPRSLLDLGPGDETLLAVARVLTSPKTDAAQRARFRWLIELLVEQWLS
jgi:transcriptional regulator with XRE-family HTH domain